MIEIHRGSEPATFMVNLLLYLQVNKWLLDAKKKNLHKVFFYGNLFHFIDDLRAVKNHL